MQISALSRQLLHLVFVCSPASTALTVPRLARRLGVRVIELRPALDELSRLGLLDAQRLRFTLLGLAVAVADGAGRSRRAPRKPRPMPALRAPIALFSEREAPRAVA